MREAKKRSPETIGILLAGNDGAGVEALVGDREVFQVVRGGVTADSLRSIIDNATRQNRLMALAHSANDTTAAMDEPTGEHIVMETAENGAPIISDGTGRMPILNPDKVAPETNVGSRAVDVLVLTKDEEFLVTVKESARGMHNIIYANTLAQADDAVRNHKVGVAVIDAAMVGDNVEKLTVHLRTTAPRLVAIVAGRRDDGEMLMDLINRGKVYRFLLKPVSPGRARLAIEASVKHHLEAPDAAFRSMGSAAESKVAPRAAAPVAKVAPKVVAQAPTPPRAAKPQASPVQKMASSPPRPEHSQKVPVIKVEPRPVPVDSASLMNDALGDAFGGDDKSFTETMTGIVRSVGSSLSSAASPKGSATVDTMATGTTPVHTASGSSGGSLFSDPKILGLGAVGVLLLVGSGWWLFGGSDVPPAAEEAFSGRSTVSEVDAVIEAPAPDNAPLGVDQLRDEARLAATAGQIFNPPGSNAIELYLAASEAAPDDAVIAAELDGVIKQALGMAEESLLARRPQDTTAALQRVALADPDNARLPFLNAQLVQMQLREFLDSARLAIRDGRYEDAAVALNGARALNSNGAAEIQLVAEELSNSLSAQRVDDVLEKANRRLDEGKLIAPSNDNARYYFELALSNDPGNTAAHQGLGIVASKLVLQARAAVDTGNFDAADNLLADARRLDPASSELASTTTALRAARDQQVQQQRAQEQRAAAAKAAADKAAKAAADKAAAAERAVADAQASVAESIADETVDETVVDEPHATAPLADDPPAAENQGPQVAIDAAPPRAAASSNIINTTPVAVSSLTRTKYVGPKYPRAAERRGLSGWVDVVFTVDIDGTVTDVSVRESNPGITFVNSAVNAVEDWEFEPVIENGVAVQKRAAVRMMFAVEQ